MVRTIITPENTDIHLSVPDSYVGKAVEVTVLSLDELEQARKGRPMNQQIFNEIQALKRELLPHGRVILFGSQARGDARPDSDWDLLVLLDKKGKITSEEDTRYCYPFADLGFNHGVCICPLIYSTEDWEKRKISPFYKNVTNEGIEIV
jgi:hypothetical protein